MAKKMNLGKVGITMGGAYDSSKSYDRLVCVAYNGESWVSVKDVPVGSAPIDGSVYWQQMSARGTQGPQGPQGPQGQSCEVPHVILSDDGIAMEFIILAIEHLLGGEEVPPKGFAPFYTTDSSGEPTSYEFCEVDVVNLHIDAATENLYGFYEFSHDGSRYRRTYNLSTETFVEEEIISSGGEGGNVEIREFKTTNSDEDKAYNLETLNKFLEGSANIVLRATTSDFGEVTLFIDTVVYNDGLYQFWAHEPSTLVGHYLYVNAINATTGEYAFEKETYLADTNMSLTSTRPVQNKVIKAYVDGLIGDINTILDSINGEEV